MATSRVGNAAYGDDTVPATWHPMPCRPTVNLLCGQLLHLKNIFMPMASKPLVPKARQFGPASCGKGTMVSNLGSGIREHGNWVWKRTPTSRVYYLVYKLRI